jgi:hypothetical protein
MNREALAELYAALYPALSGLDAPWAVIGSGALMLAGGAVEACEDLDLLTTGYGAEILEEAWRDHRDRTYAPNPAASFRSRFSAYDFPAGRVEVMGDLTLRGDGGWIPVAVPEATTVAVKGLPVRIPTLKAQAALFRRFGRPKDLAKAALVEALLVGQG